MGTIAADDWENALKNRVASAVQKTGISGRLQSELRYRLIESLHKESVTKHHTADDILLASTSPNLRDRALYSLILDFLRSREKHYALSVLLPECGMSTEDVYSYEEVGQALSLHRCPLFLSCLDVDDDDGPSLLERMLGSIATLAKPLCSTSFTQTDDDGVGQSIDAKLRACMTPAAANASKDRRTLEERMLQFQARCEARCRQEVQAELSRLKTIEQERIALEEAAKCRAQFQDSVFAMERAAREREQRLNARECSALERLRAKELDLDKKAIEWRAEVQRQLEDGLRGQTVRARKLEVEEQRINAQGLAIEQREHSVHDKMARLKEQETAMRAELDVQMRSFKSEVEASIADERESLRRRELVLEREGVHRDAERQRQKLLKEELAKAEALAVEGKNEVKALNAQRDTLERELVEHRRQVGLFSDAGQQSQLTADRLRAELAALQRELDALRTHKSIMEEADDVKRQAASKAQSVADAQIGTLQQDHDRMQAEVQQLRERLRVCHMEREDAEARVRASLEVSWDVERVALHAEVARLRQHQADGISEEQRVKEEMHRTQEQCRTARREAQELRWVLSDEAEELKRVKQHLEKMQADADSKVGTRQAFTRQDIQAELERLEEEFFSSDTLVDAPPCAGGIVRSAASVEKSKLEDQSRRLHNDIVAFARDLGTTPSLVTLPWDTESGGFELRQELLREQLQQNDLQQLRLDRTIQHDVGQERLTQDHIHEQQLELERKQQERLVKDQLQHKRVEEERLRQEQLQLEQLRQEQFMKREQLHQEQIRQEQLQQEQLKQERIKQEQLQQEQLKQEQERLRQEQLQKEQFQQEQERIRQEQLQQELLKQEQERIRQEQEQLKLRQERIMQEQSQQEQFKQEQERIRQEQLQQKQFKQEQEEIRQEQLQQEKLKQEQERTRHEQVQQEQLKQEQERIRQEQLQQEQFQQEQERIRQEQLQQEQLKQEQERIRQEQLQQEQFQQEQERKRQEQLQQELLKQEQERIRQEQLQQEQFQQEQLSREQLQQEQLKEDQLRQEQIRQERLQHEQLQYEQLRSEDQRQQSHAISNSSRSSHSSHRQRNSPSDVSGRSHRSAPQSIHSSIGSKSDKDRPKVSGLQHSPESTPQHQGDEQPRVPDVTSARSESENASERVADTFAARLEARLEEARSKHQQNAPPVAVETVRVAEESDDDEDMDMLSGHESFIESSKEEDAWA